LFHHQRQRKKKFYNIVAWSHSVSYSFPSLAVLANHGTSDISADQSISTGAQGLGFNPAYSANDGRPAKRGDNVIELFL
jgi:hypothetical protein